MHLTLHLTPNCNMRCSYCYAPPTDGPTMSLETGRKAIDFGAATTDGSCGIVYFGGEPLLARQLIYDLTEYGRQKTQREGTLFHYKITTNGLLLDDEFIDFSVRHGIMVAVSIDGTQAAHDANRLTVDGRPTYDRVLPNLERLLEKKPYSSVMMTVNPNTVAHFSQSVRDLVERGCRYLIVSLNYEASWQQADLKLLKREIERLADLYIEWTRSDRKFYLSPFEVKISSHVNQDCYEKERCQLAQKQLSVDPAGYIYPCVQFTKAGPTSRWCIGSIESGIDEPLRQAIFDESQAEMPECSECAISHRCNNTCGCLNWQTTGTLTNVSPLLCQYEQMTTAAADRIGKTLYKKRNALFIQKHYNAAYPVLSLLEDMDRGT